MKTKFGTMQYIRTAAKKYDDILFICKSEVTPSHLILICKPDYNHDNILEFMNNELPLHVTCDIIEISNDTYDNINALKLDVLAHINNEVLGLMQTHSLTYNEAYEIARRNLKNKLNPGY